MCKKHIWAAEEFLWWWADNFLIASSCSQKNGFVSTEDTSLISPLCGNSAWDTVFLIHSHGMESKWQHLWLSNRGLLFCSMLTSKGTAKVISRKDKLFFLCPLLDLESWEFLKATSISDCAVTLGPVRTVCLLEPCHYKDMWSFWSIFVSGQMIWWIFSVCFGSNSS